MHIWMELATSSMTDFSKPKTSTIQLFKFKKLKKQHSQRLLCHRLRLQLSKQFQWLKPHSQLSKFKHQLPYHRLWKQLVQEVYSKLYQWLKPHRQLSEFKHQLPYHRLWKQLVQEVYSKENNLHHHNQFNIKMDKFWLKTIMWIHNIWSEETSMVSIEPVRQVISSLQSRITKVMQDSRLYDCISLNVQVPIWILISWSTSALRRACILINISNLLGIWTFILY